jgi:hypothetical protein
MLGVKRIRTSAHHPQSNGVVEIFNKTLKTTLKMWVDENQRDWDELLVFALFAYNTSFHSLMHETPFYLNTGRQARVVTDDITSTSVLGHNDVHAYASELTKRLSDTHHRVREILEKVNEARVVNDVKCVLPVYEIGTLVWLFDPTTKKGLSRKLVRRWTGPYTIIEKHSDVNYTIMRENRTQKVHSERLRAYHDDDTQHDDNDNTQLELAQHEMQALADEIAALQARKKVIEDQHSIITANRDANMSDESVNNDAHDHDDNDNDMVLMSMHHVNVPVASLWL